MHRLLTRITAAMILAVAAFLCTPAAMADNVSFNYQGRVKVQSQPFDGIGLFKFAILNTSATAVLWSNDGTVGTGSGSETPVPSAAVALEITDGVFSVDIGNTNVAGMAALDSAVLVSHTPLRLRIWFSDGNHGFEELKPDQKLTDLTLNTIQTGLEDYTIYVNGATGNNANNGLTPQTAKKTITGAVDILPDKIRCNITVRIANGTYREMVIPHGISVAYKKALTFSGDTAWTPASPGNPAVIIDGADSGSTAVRDYGMYARQCSGMVIEGITFQNTRIAGLRTEDGNYSVKRCFARQNLVTSEDRDSGCGFSAGAQSFTNFSECAAKNNGHFGFMVHSSSRSNITTCTASNNVGGIFSVSNSLVQLSGYNLITNNSVGVQGNTFSAVGIWAGSSPAVRTHITNNTQGVVVNWESHFTPSDVIRSGLAEMYVSLYLIL